MFVPLPQDKPPCTPIGLPKSELATSLVQIQVAYVGPTRPGVRMQPRCWLYPFPRLVFPWTPLPSTVLILFCFPSPSPNPSASLCRPVLPAAGTGAARIVHTHKPHSLTQRLAQMCFTAHLQHTFLTNAVYRVLALLLGLCPKGRS